MGLFTLWGRPGPDDRIAIERAMIADCRKILSARKAHPMAVYWAKERLRAAELRLQDQLARKAIEGREAAAKARARAGPPDRPGCPYDPAGKG